MPNTTCMNERYFQTWSSNMAYILGFITADGCVVCDDGRYQLIVVSEDLDVLEFIKKELEHQKPIRKQLDSTHRLTVCRKQVVMDVMAHGILPRKSWSPLLPDVPTEYATSFVHGIFDGDGSVWQNDRAEGSTIASSITSYSKSFLEEVGRLIRSLSGSIPKVYGNSSAYRLMYSMKETLALYHLLYDDPKHDFYLSRKKAVVDDWLRDVKRDMTYCTRICRICGGRFVALVESGTKCWSCRCPVSEQIADQDIVRPTM